MSLLEFMKYMAEHPDQLSVYRRDSNIFFQQLTDAERDRLTLSEEEQQAIRLSPYTYNLYTLEVTTIMRLSLSLSGEQNAQTVTGQPDIINLEGSYVTIHAIADNDVFFAQPEGGTASCVTLPHSYIYLDNNTVHFSLNLCYTDPNNELDRPQVLYISMNTNDAVYQPNYKYKVLEINIDPHPGYILVLSKRDIEQRLGPNSQYDPATGVLALNFDHRFK